MKAHLFFDDANVKQYCTVHIGMERAHYKKITYAIELAKEFQSPLPDIPVHSCQLHRNIIEESPS